MYVFISAGKVNALAQINFNSTHFINALIARIFCLTRGPTHSWGNGDAQCYQLGNIKDPFSTVDERAQRAANRKKNTCKLRKRLPQFGNTNAANAPNTTKKGMRFNRKNTCKLRKQLS